MSTSSPASSSPRTSRVNFFVPLPHAHGVRRRREDSSAVEIEELDSRTMRQSSYNYFQQHGSTPTPTLLRTSTFRSLLERSPASRKRQRTLAEQLDGLCLQNTRGRAMGEDSAKNRSRSRSRSSRRLAKNKGRAEGGSRIVELDEFGQEKASSVDGSGSDSDGMMDTSGDIAGMKIYGDATAVGGLRSFFAAGAGGRHRPIDRMYRHYVTAAAQAQAAATTVTPQGNELVVFRPLTPVTSTFTEDLPAYLSLTPHEFEKLSMAEKRQWYQAHRQYMRELDQAAATAEQKNEQETKTETQMEAKPIDPTGGFEAARRRSSSASSSRSYQVLGVPSTDEEDDGAFDDFGEDVEMMEDIEDDAAPRQPHAAGALTHTEWFTDDEL